MWNSALEKLEHAGAVPIVGHIVGVDAKVVVKTPYRSDDTGDDEYEDAVQVKELVLNALWSEPLEDTTSVEEEQFTSHSNQATIWDQTHDEAPLAVADVVAPKAHMKEDPLDLDPINIYDDVVGIDDFDGDDGFDHSPVRIDVGRKPSTPPPTIGLAGKPSTSPIAMSTPVLGRFGSLMIKSSD
jgi:hypothetical protein